MADAALTTMTVAALGRLIRDARVSPVEVAEAFLDRSDALQPPPHALTTVPECTVTCRHRVGWDTSTLRKKN